MQTLICLKKHPPKNILCKMYPLELNPSNFWLSLQFEGCVCYIFASVFFVSKTEYFYIAKENFF